MKFSLVAFAAAALAALVDANGVCYDPDHTSSKSASTVAADMSTIAGYGFDSVRTYISYFGNTEMGPIITAAGLTAALGVPYPQSDYSSQATAAIKAANSGGVSHIFVGNENLAGAGSVPSAMIELIYSIKSQVPGSVKVGTVQRNTEVINYASISGWSDLVSACDVLGVNVHPFFTSGTSASTAMALVKTQWNTMYSNFGSKLLLTETGWPTGGSYAGNTGSVSGLETFYSDYNSWRGSQSQSYFFQMFDTPSKSESYEQVFGLLTYDSQSKFGMSTTTSAPTTTAPATTTPAPTTEAPTPEPTTEAPTATPEATEAETEAPTATPEPTEAETSSASTDAELEPLNGSASSGSLSSLAGSNSTASDADDDDMVGSYGSDSVADEADAGTSKTSLSSTDSTTAGTAGTAAGTSGTSDAQRTAGADNSQSSEKANTQSEGSSSGTYVGLAVAGGACAAMVAFGFIYQTRKRAQELEEMDDKREDSWPSAVTPVENINVL